MREMCGTLPLYPARARKDCQGAWRTADRRGTPRDKAGAGHVAQCPKLTGSQNRFDMGIAASSAHLAHFVVKRLPVARQHMATADYNVDFLRASGHTVADFLDAQVERGQPSRKACGNSGHRDIRPTQRVHSGFDHVVINANGPSCQALHTDCFEQILRHWLTSFGAKTPHAAFAVVT